MSILQIIPELHLLDLLIYCKKARTVFHRVVVVLYEPEQQI